MSHEGQMLRGQKWKRHLDAGETLDDAKMADVNYFLENSEEKEDAVQEEEKPKVSKKGKK
jgi:hypothetical protein